MYELTLIDTIGKTHTVTYETGEYDNLMELIVNSFYEEIGDCRGRAWCGTCAVTLLSGKYCEQMDKEERLKLDELEKTSTMRLSCQLLVDEKLNGTKWLVAGSDWF